VPKGVDVPGRLWSLIRTFDADPLRRDPPHSHVVVLSAECADSILPDEDETKIGQNSPTMLINKDIFLAAAQRTLQEAEQRFDLHPLDRRGRSSTNADTTNLQQHRSTE
jgi:hypothetical protein